MPLSQADRLLAYLRANPGASSLEIVRDLSVVNTTGRISDLRARGFQIQCKPRSWDGNAGFWLVDKAQLELALA